MTFDFPKAGAILGTVTSNITAFIVMPRLPQNYDEVASLVAIISGIAGIICALYTTFRRPPKVTAEDLRSLLEELKADQ